MESLYVCSEETNGIETLSVVHSGRPSPVPFQKPVTEVVAWLIIVNSLSGLKLWGRLSTLNYLNCELGEYLKRRPGDVRDMWLFLLYKVSTGKDIVQAS